MDFMKPEKKKPQRPQRMHKELEVFSFLCALCDFFVFFVLSNIKKVNPVLRGQPRYLVLHRSKTEKVYPGIFQFITAAIEAAKREMLEEIRVSPKNLWVVLYVSPVFLVEVENDEFF